TRSSSGVPRGNTPTAFLPERSAVVSGKNAVGVFPRGTPELDLVCKAECSPHRRARRISHLYGAGFSGKTRSVPLPNQPGVAASLVHAENSVQAGTAAA